MDKLPECIWEVILKLVTTNDDYRDFGSLSLTCKQLLFMTNRLRRKFSAFDNKLYRSRCEALWRALERFQNIEKLELYRLCDSDDSKPDSQVDIDTPICKIASFGLYSIRSLTFYCLPKAPLPSSLRELLSTMRNLKRLICWDVKSLGDVHVVAIADAVPWLEELGIIFRNSGGSQDWRRAQYHQLSDRVVTDAGIQVVSSKLAGLLKIDITGNHFCSDLSLIALSSNCARLEELRCTENGITKDGIGFVLYNSPNLISLQAEYRSTRNSSFSFVASQICAKNLRELDLCAHRFQDPLLCCIAKADIPLEKLTLRNDDDLSFNGLSTVLCACPSLKHLELRSISFLDDDSIRKLCRYLANLLSVKLQWCRNLTIVTYFILAKYCPALSEIKLEFLSSRSFDVDCVHAIDLVNSQIVTLDLCGNRHLKDELLRQIVVTCPYLRSLDVRQCDQLTIEGFWEILNHCSRINHLRVSRRMEVLSENFETRHIKVEYL